MCHLHASNLQSLGFEVLDSKKGRFPSLAILRRKDFIKTVFAFYWIVEKVEQHTSARTLKSFRKPLRTDFGRMDDGRFWFFKS